MLVLLLFVCVLGIDKSWPHSKGETARYSGEDEKIGLGALYGFPARLICYDQRLQYSRLVESCNQQEGIAGGIVEHECGRCPVRHPQPQVRYNADQERYQVADNRPYEYYEVPIG